MKKKLKNSEVFAYLRSLRPLLAPRDKVGYVAARNYRFLSDSIMEFDAIRLSLTEKHDKKGKDERDALTYTFKMDSPNFRQLHDELAPFNEMGYEMGLMMAKYGDTVGNLSGEEILAIDWMLEDQEGVS